jgi:hypothetical protein
MLGRSSSLPGKMMTDRSFVIGGGDWGQNVNETLLNQIVGVTPTWDNPLEHVERQLLRLPLDALKQFEPVVGGDFGSETSAVTTIMGALKQKPDLLKFFKDVINNLVNGWQGLIEGDWDFLDIYATMEQIAAAIATLNSDVAALFAGGSDGISETENFGQYPDGGPGSKWVTWHKGLAAETISIKDGKMWLFCFPLATRSGWAKYVAEDTGTDYQRVGAVFASKPQTGLFNATAYNYIMGRVAQMGSTDTTATFVFAKLGAKTAEIGVNIRGTETILKAAPTFNFNPAAAYTLQCGVKGVNGAADAPYTFRLFEGSIQILEAIDSSKISFVGSTHRYTGLAFANANALQSGKVAQFVMFDSK